LIQKKEGSPLEINLTSDVPIYEQLVNEIRRMMENGQLKPGDALPPVRQLAAQLDVAPNTVARAYQELTSLELIEGNRRRGSIVRRNVAVVAGQDARLFKEIIVKLIQQGKSRREIEATFKSALRQIFE
jgi:DNA-binding transcriptional regulator YhcF (GntR family)